MSKAAKKGGMELTLDEFRLKHSELIEHYQFIEHHLEDIYADIQGKKDFYGGLMDVEKDNIPRLRKKLLELQEKTGIPILSEMDCAQLEEICGRRNFWCHNCYVDIVFDAWTAGPKKPQDIKQMEMDYVKAKQMRDYLFVRKIQLKELVKAERNKK